MTLLLRDAWRGLRARRAAAAVSIGGLMLAMAACALLGVMALALAEPDPAISEPERVVLLDFRRQLPKPGPWTTMTPIAFGPLLKQRQAPLDLVSRLSPGGIDFTLDGRLQPAFKLIADPDLVPLLNLKAVAGDLRATLQRHDGIAITRDLLHKLWGELPPADAIGRRIDGEGGVYTVGAVMPDTDPRTPFWESNPMVGRAMAMVGYGTQGDTTSEDDRTAIHRPTGRVFARLKPGASAAQVGGWMHEAFVVSPNQATLPTEWRQGRDGASFRALPLTVLPFEGEGNETRWMALTALGAGAGLLLLLAAFNTMNLQTALLLQRQRETAVRRSLGANGAQLLRLWALEALLQLVLAAAGALLLAWWFAPPVGQWLLDLSPRQPVGDPLPGIVPAGVLIGVLVLLPLILGVPAAAALRRAPAPALQGRTAGEGPWGRRVRQGLLAVQLTGAILLLSLAGVMALQQQHLLQADRGFDTRNRLWLGMMVNPEKMPNLEGLVAALRAHPAIRHWAFSSARPAGDPFGQTDQLAAPGGAKQVLRVTTVSPGFFDTYGMTLLAGQPRAGGGEAAVVIDAKAARGLGFATPQAAVGALIHGGAGPDRVGDTPHRVVAVVRDVKLESAREPAQPQAFVLSDAPQWDLSVFGPDPVALHAALAQVWQQHGPKLPHMIQSADEQRADVYRVEARLTAALAGLAVLAVGVAMLGAYALVADTLRRRRTELVLRRLHGAGAGAIARRVATEFAWPLGLALLSGLPLVLLAGEAYLAGFVDRIDPVGGVLLPAAAALAATVMVTALAAWRHTRIALALRPIEALR